MYGPTWPFLLTYGSHDMRHTGFRRLTVVSGLPGFGASHFVGDILIYSQYEEEHKDHLRIIL